MTRLDVLHLQPGWAPGPMASDDAWTGYLWIL
jgi:hypothetical protein